MAEPRGPRMSPVGLTPTQFNLLASAGWLARTGEAPTQQQVAEQAGTDRMMASKVLRGLQERGLIVRATDPNDSRSLRLRLTDEGRALVGRAVRSVVDLDEELFGDDGDRLREQLRDIAMRTRQDRPAARSASTQTARSP
jgi:DNA-binding MarR family transcriptional regulator